MAVKGLSLEELFGELGKQARDDDDDDRDDRLSTKDRVAYLIEGLSEFSTGGKFKVGDIIRGKQSLTKHLRDTHQPHIVMELLDEPIKLSLDASDVGTCSAVQKYDMVIGCVVWAGKKKAIARYYADRREWELYPDADKMRETHS